MWCLRNSRNSVEALSLASRLSFDFRPSSVPPGPHFLPGMNAKEVQRRIRLFPPSPAAAGLMRMISLPHVEALAVNDELPSPTTTT